MKKIIFLIIAVIILAACEKSGVGETVETANILYPMKDIPYKFKRNGMSSVDYYEVTLLTDQLARLKRRMRLGNKKDYDYNTFMKLYNEGDYSYIKPSEQIASSELSETQKVRADLIQLIEVSRQIEKQVAEQGKAGYVGGDVGFAEKIYVDANGVAFAEVFANILDGAIFLDKILYKHLDDKLFTNKKLQSDHENLQLISGKNYTELEHHWDLAYGYFTQIQGLTQANGLSALKGIERKILDAFVRGRMNLANYHYDLVQQQIAIIRTELSRAFAIQTVEKLTGKITEVNYQEAPKQAFKYISQAYGMIYSLQFTRQADGEYFFTYDQVKNIQAKLLENNGLWDSERLLSDEQTSGSLKNIAKTIADKYEL